ncbi:MAG: peptidylprolyl isomerase [Cyclobacteriaceae bacterium]|nr:peptidylprolyl isomerase [Cyclobacteriaceae bacterium]
MALAFMAISCSDGDKNMDSLVKIHTSLGDITVLLFEDTPKHKESFLSMAEEGLYDSTSFHRVMSNFMIQGGDLGSKPGFSNESKRLIPSEITTHHLHAKGALAAARQPDNVNPERKSSTQFYIVHGRMYTEKEMHTDLTKLNYAAGRYLQSEANLPLRDTLLLMQEQGRMNELQQILIELKEEISAYTALNLDKKYTPEQIAIYTSVGGYPSLDFEYTVFGQVLEGIDVVDKIAMAQTGVADKPIEDIFMTLEIIEIPKTEVTAKYGYKYPVLEDKINN